MPPVDLNLRRLPSPSFRRSVHTSSKRPLEIPVALGHLDIALSFQIYLLHPPDPANSRDEYVILGADDSLSSPVSHLDSIFSDMRVESRGPYDLLLNLLIMVAGYSHATVGGRSNCLKCQVVAVFGFQYSRDLTILLRIGVNFLIMETIANDSLIQLRVKGGSPRFASGCRRKCTDLRTPHIFRSGFFPIPLAFPF